MKKVFYNIILIILLVIPFAVKADVDVDSNGNAITGGTTTNVSTGLRISGDGDYGVRITVVDENGNRKSERTIDYWQSSFSSSTIKQMPGATYKTAIVNQGGLGYTPLQNFGPYTYGTDAVGNLLYDANHISGAGTGSWSTKHITLENIIDREVNGDSCKNPDFLNDVGFDVCKYVENNECEELKKTYVLIEPLVRMHDDNYVYYVFSGTEAANFFAASHAAGEISTNTYKNNFGGSVYRNLINMYLTNQEDNDSLKYQLKSNGSIYAYFTSQPTSNNAGNEPSNRMDIFAGKAKDSNGNPWGSSMQLVWLGKAAKNCDEPKGCCVPCGKPEDYTDYREYEACVTNAGDNFHPDDPYCCYETGDISEDGTVEACEPAEKYWEDKQDFFELYCKPCCIPSAIDSCCEDTGVPICDGTERKSYSDYWADKQDLFEEYCGNKTNCSVPNLEPEIIVNYCDDDNTNNTSYFRDGVFNSSGGQFAQYNTTEKIEKAIVDGKLPADWVMNIANDFSDNTFLAVAYSNDARYSTKINDYCKIHCQEVFEVDLPDNYPYVEAGRYFKWTIKDSENDIAKATGAKICAVDIDLDKAIDNYQEYSKAARDAAADLANLTCNDKWGVQPVTDGDFANCNAYASEYEDHCAPTSVCIEAGQAGQCPIYCTKSVTDQNGHTHSEQYICGWKPNYVCTKELTGKDAQHWYAFIGGTAYSPSCGSLGQHFVKSQVQVCEEHLANYKANVEGFSPKTAEIFNNVLECHQSGNILLDMNIELEYQTLFDVHTYSTPTDIEKINGAGGFGVNYACVDNNDECNTEHVFTMSERDDGITCLINDASWVPGATEDYEGVCGAGAVKPVDPNADLGNRYAFGNVKMLNVDSFSRCSGFIEAGPPFDYSSKELWNTVYVSYISTSDLYRLNEKINACICKDGEVRDRGDDGSCSCVREVSYKSFKETYNNYQELPDGTLSVEFMNGSGLYPIGLKYWILGSVDENGEGHFDTIVDDLGIEECTGGECIYGDPYGICRFVVKNRIIASPDDDGICVNPPCDDDDDDGICVDPPCDDDDDDDIGDYGECIVDGKPVPECGDVAGLNVIYRLIDLDNPFPGADGSSRIPGKNWSGKESIITENRGANGMGVYSLEPLYSLTLTPAAIKEIRKDNHDSMDGDYLKGTLIYPSNSPGTYGGGYSLFIHEELENIAVSYGGNFSIKITNDDRFSDILKTR